MTDDSLITYGSAIKAVGSRGFQGYALLYGGVDLENETFPPSVDLGLDGRLTLPALWRHGLDPEIGIRKFAEASFRRDEKGLFVSGEFRRLDQIENDLLSAIHREKLGFSSGSSSHLVRKKQRGATVEISHWPIAEVSLTPTPIEPRTLVLPLKDILREVSLKDLLARDYDDAEREQYYDARAERDFEAEALLLRVKLAVLHYERISGMQCR
ncbi:hypothetical protein BH20ACI3_BH20ACI3_43240 [soil metagenome]